MPDTIPTLELKTPQEMLDEVHFLDYPAGCWSPMLLSGQPVAFFVTRLLQRAGVPEDHEFRDGIEWIHPSENGEVLRLPTPFPPENWEELVPKLQTVGDWLDLVSKVDTQMREKPKTEPQFVTVAEGVAQINASNAQPLPAASDQLQTAQAVADMIKSPKATEKAPPEASESSELEPKTTNLDAKTAVRASKNTKNSPKTTEDADVKVETDENTPDSATEKLAEEPTEQPEPSSETARAE